MTAFGHSAYYGDEHARDRAASVIRLILNQNSLKVEERLI
jgi:hypothetical protein